MGRILVEEGIFVEEREFEEKIVAYFEKIACFHRTTCS